LPFTQRGNVDREHVESIEEIASKRAGVDTRLQVAIRGRDHADIGVNGLRSTDALELALLEHPQQSDLRLRRQLANLIKEERAAFRKLETTEAPLERSREGALFVTEQLRADQCLRDGGTIHADEGALGPARPLVNGTGDELLPGARLAGDQDRRLRRGYPCD